MKASHRIVAAAAIVALISSCGSSASQSPAPAASAITPVVASTSESQVGSSVAAPSTVAASPKETNVAPSAHVEPALQGLVDTAIADLATRLNIAKASIVTISAQSVVWPDGGIGCPQPGMVYKQVTVDGTLIELAVGSTTYRYHSGGSRSQFLCTKS